MHEWIRVTLILCLFGTLREIRPSEPFVSEFLLGPWRNITNEQLQREIYPIGSYSYMGLLVLVFLITDFLRFKPVIILSGLSGISVYAILLWTKSIEWLQASQLLYGLYMATEVAYYTYIYAKVEPAKYQKVSSYTRIAALTGRFLSGASAQLLVFFKAMDYRQLNFITFTAQIVATFWALWLPAVPYGIYFHRRSPDLNKPTDQLNVKADNREEQPFSQQVTQAFTYISRHAASAYSRPRVLAWSALYAASLALFVQTQTYVQLLWMNIQTKDTIAYNGLVEAVQTLLGALGAYTASVLAPASLPAPTAAAQALAAFVAAHVNSVVASYAGYIVLGMLFHYNITLASAKIASQLSDDSCFGLIFGINTLVGTALQSLLTLILIQTIQLDIKSQYYTISALYLILAAAWLLGWLVYTSLQKKRAEISSQL